MVQLFSCIVQSNTVLRFSQPITATSQEMRTLHGLDLGSNFIEILILKRDLGAVEGRQNNVLK